MWLVNSQNDWVFDFVHHLVFWTLENTTFCKLDLFFSPGEGEDTYLLGPLERANLNHWTTHVNITTAIYTWDQALSKGDNWKIGNKNCDKLCTDLKLR
jgi:hypothetical protein